jgi:hypothetical protein
VSSQFLEDHLFVLQPVASGQHPLSPRVVHLALQYLTHALDLKESYKLLKPHVEGLLVQVCACVCAVGGEMLMCLFVWVPAVKELPQEQQGLRRLAGVRCSARHQLD